MKGGECIVCRCMVYNVRRERRRNPDGYRERIYECNVLGSSIVLRIWAASQRLSFLLVDFKTPLRSSLKPVEFFIFNGVANAEPRHPSQKNRDRLLQTRTRRIEIGLKSKSYSFTTRTISLCPSALVISKIYTPEANTRIEIELLPCCKIHCDTQLPVMENNL